MGEPDSGPFSSAAGILRVNIELDEVQSEGFEEEVRRLVESDAPAPVLDLAGISFIPSYHIAGLRSAADECARSGRSMTVLAKRSVTMMLDKMGLGVLARLKTVDE